MKIILAFALLLAGGPSAGFEFRGLRTGLTEDQIKIALAADAEPGRSTHVDCILSTHDQRMCSLGSYAVILTSGGVVASVHYRFKSGLVETPTGFVRAFENKYGKATISSRLYTTRLGVQFSASEYAWRRGTQLLTIEEACGGEVGAHSVNIDDTTYVHGPEPRI